MARFLSSSDLSHQPQHRIIELIHYALFERNNGVIRDVDFFRANFRAALCDIAKPEAQLFFQQPDPRLAVKRMHFQASNPHEEPRSAKLLVLVVLS
jgi:hypothetical protein